VSVTVREQHKLRVFEYRVLGRKFVLKGDEVIGEWRNFKMESFTICTHSQISLGRSN
jgi:hypothetical protein